LDFWAFGTGDAKYFKTVMQIDHDVCWPMHNGYTKGGVFKVT